ncbi:MAG: hypothetical protein V7750_14435 [Sneathiella sp.]
MTGLLTRLAARAKGLPIPLDSSVRSGLKPQLPGRFETSVEQSFDAVNVENISAPALSPTDEMQKHEKSAFPTKETNLDHLRAHTEHAIDRNSPSEAEKPLPLQPIDRTTPEAELTPNTSSNAPAEKDTGQVFNTKKNMVASIDQKTPQSPRTSYPNDRTTDQRASDLLKRDTEIQSTPVKLQAQTPTENPLVGPHSFAEITARSNNAAKAMPAPPDVVIQIDRIDIQVEKPTKEPLRKPVKKPELTDLSSYLTGKRDRR